MDHRREDRRRGDTGGSDRHQQRDRRSRSPGRRRKDSHSPERKRRASRSPDRRARAGSKSPSRRPRARSPERDRRRSRSPASRPRDHGAEFSRRSRADDGRSSQPLQQPRAERDGSRPIDGDGKVSAGTAALSEEDVRAARLAAWRAKSASGIPVATSSSRADDAPKAHSAKLQGIFGDDDGPTGNAPGLQPASEADVQAEIWLKRKRGALREAEEAREASKLEVDPLDAFMAAEVLPEVKAKEEEEHRQKQAERIAMLERMQAGKEPAAAAAKDDDEQEEVADLEFVIPKHKVKLIIGAGGERIKLIQRKTKTRIQVKKEAADLQREFGTGTKINLPTKVAMAAAKLKGEEPEFATVMIFGEPQRVAQAKEMLLEAVDNKEQKQKQRQKEYEKKREEKARVRSIYYLRHANDYEALGVPVGTPKADLKKAYRKLAMKWHPDKHPNNLEEAKAKFQAIQKAYDSLMTTDEDTRVEAIAQAGRT